MGRGEVVVISNSGPDLSETCMTALGVEREYRTSHEDQQALAEAICHNRDVDPHNFNTQPVMKAMDWDELVWVLANGFTFYNQESTDDEASDSDTEVGVHAERRTIMRIIVVMRDTLTRHFRFCHHNRDSATFLFGGFTPHGSIVGILGMHCLIRAKPCSKAAGRSAAYYGKLQFKMLP